LEPSKVMSRARIGADLEVDVSASGSESVVRVVMVVIWRDKDVKRREAIGIPV